MGLRLRVFLMFCALAAGLLAVGTGAWWLAALRDDPALGLVLGVFGTLGLVAWVWWLFDRHMARPIQHLAGSLGTGTQMDPAHHRYMDELRAAAQINHPNDAAIMAEILADPGIGLILSDCAGHIVMVNAAAQARLGAVHCGMVLPELPADARRRDLSCGQLVILPATQTSAGLERDLNPLILNRIGDLGQGRYMVIDLETTGLDTTRDGIVQIAACEVSGGRLTGHRFETLVNPARPIPALASQIHGIGDDDVQTAPTEAEALRQLHDFVGDAILVAHHAGFDMGVLTAAQSRGAPPFCNQVIDTAQISAMIWGQAARHDLDALVARLGIDLPPTARHTAMGDAQATAQAFLRMLPALAARGIVTPEQIPARQYIRPKPR